jgi:hypothetical protein
MSRKTDRAHAFNLIFQAEFLRGDSGPNAAELIEKYFLHETFAGGDEGPGGSCIFLEEFRGEVDKGGGGVLYLPHLSSRAFCPGSHRGDPPRVTAPDLYDELS